MPSIHSLLTWHCIANGRKHTQLVKEWQEIPFPSRLQLSSTLSKIQLFFSLNILGTAIKKRLLTTQLGTKKLKNKNVIHALLAQDPSLQYHTAFSRLHLKFSTERTPTASLESLFQTNRSQCQGFFPCCSAIILTLFSLPLLSLYFHILSNYSPFHAERKLPFYFIFFFAWSYHCKSKMGKGEKVNQITHVALAWSKINI